MLGMLKVEIFQYLNPRVGPWSRMSHDERSGVGNLKGSTRALFRFSARLSFDKIAVFRFFLCFYSYATNIRLRVLTELNVCEHLNVIYVLVSFFFFSFELCVRFALHLFAFHLFMITFRVRLCVNRRL